jgi:hypothetical protein
VTRPTPGHSGIVARVPPFFDRTVPERACSRAINTAGDPCGGEAFLHVAWADTPEGVEAGWVCTLHASELSTHWPPLQTHEPGPDCGMPGALWFFEENVCRCPDPEPESTAVAEREAAVAPGTRLGVA